MSDGVQRGMEFEAPGRVVDVDEAVVDPGRGSNNIDCYELLSILTNNYLIITLSRFNLNLY